VRARASGFDAVLSLEPEFRRSTGAFDKALARRLIDLRRDDWRKQ